MSRRKITKKDAEKAAAKQDADELPDLTEKEQKFLEGLLENQPATVAYRAAFDCSNMLPATVQCAASKLRHNAKLSKWLSAARKAYLGTAVVTLDSHVRELERLREESLDSGNMGAAIQAEQLRGKASALYVERYENVTPPDPVRRLRELAKIDPRIGEALAARLAMPAPEAEPSNVITLKRD
jgi:hypothetical protein